MKCPKPCAEIAELLAFPVGPLPGVGFGNDWGSGSGGRWCVFPRPVKCGVAPGGPIARPGRAAQPAPAIVLADGLAAGGREGARDDALRVYWQKVSALSARGIFKPSSVDKGNSDSASNIRSAFGFSR